MIAMITVSSVSWIGFQEDYNMMIPEHFYTKLHLENLDIRLVTVVESTVSRMLSVISKIWYTQLN